MVVLSLTPENVVPAAIAVGAVQASLYDVPGGYRAVMFDRFTGVKDTVCQNSAHLLAPLLT